MYSLKNLKYTFIRGRKTHKCLHSFQQECSFIEILMQNSDL